MPVTPTATHWGPYLIESDGRRVVAVHPHPSDPDPSPIGQGMVAATANRVERPAIRRSWLERGPGAGGELRGRDPFVEVSWDRALDLVAGELSRVRADHGHGAIYAGSYGWGSSGRFHQPSSQRARFFAHFGGCTASYGTYSSAAAEAIVPHIYGMSLGQAVAEQTSWSEIVANTDLMVSFGGLRLSNTQVTFGGQGPHTTRRWLDEARDRGVRFANIGPIADDQPDDLDNWWLPIRPGTDVALMAGLIHTLVVGDRADHDFLEHHCYGWERLWSSLSGHGDQPAATATWAAGICGLPASDIELLAEEMASGRTLVNLSLSVQRADHGEQPYWMGLALAAVLGQIGLAGGGIAFPFGASGTVGAGQRRKPVPGLPVPPRDPGPPLIPVSRIVELLERPGQGLDANGTHELLPEARLVYWAGGNVFHHHQDLNRLSAAWSRPETIVVHEPFWTATAKRADVVLPVTTPLERDDIGSADSLVVAMKQAIEPVGESRNDHWVFAGLAERLGFGPRFTEGRSEAEWIRHLYERFRRRNDDAPPFDEFWERGWLAQDVAPMGEPSQVFLAEFRADPVGAPLRTPSGRLQLWSETIESFGYDDCHGGPRWFEPFERLGRADTPPGSLHLVSNQPRHRLHSQYDHGPTSQRAKVAGREPLRINPADATARSIAAGDVVEVSNERGCCLAGAVLTSAVAEGVVELATGAWYDPDEDGTCKHGNPNVLTADKGTSRLGQGPSAQTCLVTVRRFEGAPPAVTAFDPPVLLAGD